MPKFKSVNGEWKEVVVVENVTVPEPEVKVEVVVEDNAVSYDINQDGVVDDKDASLAGKVLSAVGGKRGRKKKSN